MLLWVTDQDLLVYEQEKNMPSLCKMSILVVLYCQLKLFNLQKMALDDIHHSPRFGNVHNVAPVMEFNLYYLILRH